MTNLKNHPGMWLSDPAADSLERFEKDHGRISLNSAGRTEAEQQKLIDRWDKGGTYNRPPYLYPPYRPAAKGPHVGGNALDTSQIQLLASKGRPYGWVQNLPKTDPVHFIYDPSKDQKRPTSSALQVTRDRQNWLNRSRGAGLVIDGIAGPATVQAYKNYQTYLKSKYGYTGAIDGVWGPATQEAHLKYYKAWNTPANPVPPASGVPTGLRWYGIQEMLRGAGYGYTGLIDGIPGPQTIKAFQNFLARGGFAPGLIDSVWGAATGKAAQRWLRARWKYTGPIDNIWGSGSRASWAEAERKNAAAF